MLLVVLGTAAIEATLRFAQAVGRRAMVEGVEGTGALVTMRSPDPELVYTYRPSTSVTNSQGYRDREHTFAKPPGTRRVVVIGDSVAEGLGVAREDAFPRVLETLLNAEAPTAARVEVVVLARTGYSTSQELVLLRDEAFRYAPDLIVWSYVLNDPAHPVYHNANGELGRYYDRPPFYVGRLLARVAFLARERILSIGKPSEFHLRLHAVYWDEVEANLARVGAAARDHHVPVLFFVVPLFEGVDFTDYRWKDLHARLDASAQRDGLVTVDVLSALAARRESPAALGTPGDPWHPRAAGHHALAEILAAATRERELLPPR